MLLVYTGSANITWVVVSTTVVEVDDPQEPNGTYTAWKAQSDASIQWSGMMAGRVTPEESPRTMLGKRPKE